MKWFRQGPSPYQTALAMVGAKPGDRLLVHGAAHPALIAELARVTGLNGRALVTGADASGRAAVEAAAAAAGALVEFDETGPPPAGTPETSDFDVAVLLTRLAPLDSGARDALARAVLGALRSGGRLIVVDGEKRARFSRQTPARLPSGDVLALLERAGAHARRQLADVEGTAYYEARK